MSNIKHIHGPWQVVIEPILQMKPDYDVPTIQDVATGTLIGVVSDAKRELPNAHLIAAAPLLLSELEAAVGNLMNAKFDMEHDTKKDFAIGQIERAIARAKAAIAKAKGETP